MRRVSLTWATVAALATFVVASSMGAGLLLAQSDPLPAWNDSSAKAAIVGFVKRVTDRDSADFVAPADRIAVFDNDGTLWAEQPIYFQLAFAMDTIKSLAHVHPEWATTQPYKAVLENDHETLAAAGENGLLQIVTASHTGMSPETFNELVSAWLSSAEHPRFKRPYNKLAYQPMLDLLDYLRANSFKTFIVSGGGVEFMRCFAEETYGIPPEQVIGSSGVVKFEVGRDGKPNLVKEAQIEFIDDGPGKPVGIYRFIGRRPIFAFGNSDGDLQMLQYTAAGSGARFMGLVHHTDAEREWAYDRASKIGKLDKALDAAAANGWTVVDMKADWKVIFPN